MANYSNSKCPKCSNSTFEIAEDVPTGSKFKLYFIRCESCKTIVGTVPFYNTGAILDALARELNIDPKKLF